MWRTDPKCPNARPYVENRPQMPVGIKAREKKDAKKNLRIPYGIPGQTLYRSAREKCRMWSDPALPYRTRLRPPRLASGMSDPASPLFCSCRILLIKNGIQYCFIFGSAGKKNKTFLVAQCFYPFYVCRF